MQDLFTLPYNLLRNTSLNILGKVNHISLTHEYLLNVYWEWYLKSSIDHIISYTQSIGTENPVTVKIVVHKKVLKYLNSLCGLGCFILLCNEHSTSTRKKIIQKADVTSRYSEMQPTFI
jgi:hypothetical protein